jgi:hypothetical protein
LRASFRALFAARFVPAVTMPGALIYYRQKMRIRTIL